MTEEQHEILMEHAITWFTEDKNGNQERPGRFLWKAMVKGYTEEFNGEKHTIKLTMKWFRKQMGEEAWKNMKRDFALGFFIGLGGAGVTSYVYHVCRIRNDKAWTPEFEEFINTLFAVAMGYLYTRAMLKLTTPAVKPVCLEIKGGDISDSGI